MKRSRIAFRGNFKPEHSTESHVSATMEQMGHEVIRIQEDEVGWGAVPERADGADLFWWTCTWHEDIPGARAALAILDERMPTVSHHLDLYVGLDREAQMADDPFWRTRYIFTADGGHDETFASMGINHHWIRPGVYGPECEPGTAREEWVADVGFVGAYRRYHPEHPFRKDLVKALARRYGDRYRHFAGGVGPAVRGQDLNDALASVKIIVGDSCNPGFALRRYWSDRVYETIGRGGFIIHPDIEGIRDEFTDGETIALYRHGDLDDLFDRIGFYLREDEERERIRKAGHEFVRAHATYRNRLAEIFAILVASEPQLRSTPEKFQVRPGTDDAVVRDEIWDEEVYQIRDDLAGGGLVLDVGAHVGFFSAWALENGADAIIALEPNQENFGALTRNLDACGLSGRITTRRQAIWRGPATGRTGSSGGGSQTREATGGDVDMIGLDDLLEPVHDIAVLKMDCEGAEYPAFEGVSPEQFCKVKTLVMEFHNVGTGSAEAPDLFGRMITKIAETHHVEIIGRPSNGGMIYARRYDA